MVCVFGPSCNVLVCGSTMKIQTTHFEMIFYTCVDFVQQLSHVPLSFVYLTGFENTNRKLLCLPKAI
jgi:hypothetical protein